MDEKVTILNPPAAAFASQFETFSYFIRKFIVSTMSDLLDKEQLFITKTAGEILFDGYDDPMNTYAYEKGMKGQGKSEYLNKCDTSIKSSI